MNRTTSLPPDAVGEQDNYILKGLSSHMSRRTAQKQAQFFLPYLRADMRLLDCGCGPGSITLGLAALVAPGEAVGIDVNPDEIELAQALAAEHGVHSIHFETADVYELPFADASFDAVFSHALLEHLRDPLKALKEMRRVLNPGGVIGVRAPDYDGNLWAPIDPAAARLGELYRRLSQSNGGNPGIGKHLRALLREAGFAGIESSASYDCWVKSDSSVMPLSEQFVKLGWLDDEAAETMEKAFERWLDHPDMFNARAYCEAVGWKP